MSDLIYRLQHSGSQTKDIVSLLHEAAGEITQLDNDMETAWGLIANAWFGDWEFASKEWRKAAEKWRDVAWNRVAGRQYREQATEMQIIEEVKP